jgi:hypothetical protein
VPPEIAPPRDQRLARRLIGPLVATPITPNQITTPSLAIGLLAAGLYAAGGTAAHTVGACFRLAFLLDHLLGPVTWLGLHEPFLILAGIGALLFALLVLRQGRGVPLEQRT